MTYSRAASGGSRFSFESDVEVVGVVLEDSESRTETRRLDGKRVLVVDDNPTGLKVSSALLRKLGAQVDVANDGIEAIESCKESSFDVVLVDLQMPQMDGFEAARRIMKVAVPPKRIVAFTASTSESVTKKVEQSGMNGIVFKPFDENDLADAVLGSKGASSRSELFDLKDDLIQHSIHNFMDEEVVSRLSAIDEGDSGAFLKDLLSVFLNHGKEKFEQLVDAVNESDFLEAKRLAHNLRGSSANVGMTGLVDRFKGLEIALSDGSKSDADALVTELTIHLREVFSAIQRFVEE